jgi:hypothetical protein
MYEQKQGCAAGTRRAGASPFIILDNNRAPWYRHRNDQTVQAILQLKNIDTHTSVYRLYLTRPYFQIPERKPKIKYSLLVGAPC